MVIKIIYIHDIFHTLLYKSCSLAPTTPYSAICCRRPAIVWLVVGGCPLYGPPPALELDHNLPFVHASHLIDPMPTPLAFNRKSIPSPVGQLSFLLQP